MELANALESEPWQKAPLNKKEAALCAWAEKLTLTPTEMKEGDVKTLRQIGWSDSEIHDAAQVISYFNYINRIAEGLGVDTEPD